MTTLSKRLGGLVLVLMVAVFMWYARYAQLPDVLYAGTTESENTLLALVDGGQLRKYQINKLLPAGTTIKVWMEAYESGTRVDDVAVSIAQLKSQQRGICFYSLEQEGKVATAIDGFPESVGRGSYPLERWFETTSAMGGSGWGATCSTVVTP